MHLFIQYPSFSFHFLSAEMIHKTKNIHIIDIHYTSGILKIKSYFKLNFSKPTYRIPHLEISPNLKSKTKNLESGISSSHNSTFPFYTKKKKKKQRRKKKKERKKFHRNVAATTRIRQIAWRSIVSPSASLQFPSPSSEQKRLQRFQFTLR